MNSVLTLELVNNMLSDIADEIPSDFFKELNGGIILVENYKLHPDSKEDHPLYIMGEYTRSNIGSQIKIYYGSFKQIYLLASESKIREELKKILIHEFTHHLEYRAGLRGLEIKDAQELNAYNHK